MSGSEVGDRLDVLVFDLGDLRFGVNADAVLQIVRAVAPTPLSTTVPFIEGMIDLRGTLVPVVDVRHRCGLPPRELSADDHMIIALCRERMVALRVDRVDDLMNVAISPVDGALEVVGAASEVSGVGRAAGELIVIRDLDTFLTASELEAIDRLVAERAVSEEPHD